MLCMRVSMCCFPEEGDDPVEKQKMNRFRSVLLEHSISASTLQEQFEARSFPEKPRGPLGFQRYRYRKKIRNAACYSLLQLACRASLSAQEKDLLAIQSLAPSKDMRPQDKLPLWLACEATKRCTRKGAVLTDVTHIQSNRFWPTNACQNAAVRDLSPTK